MNNEELKKFIMAEVLERVRIEIDNNYNQASEILSQFTRAADDFHTIYVWIKKRLEDIEYMIQTHAKGVQEVYTQMQEIKNFFELSKIDNEMIEKIARIKEIME